MPDTVAAHAVISGRVQGVFYRASTEAEARKLGLCGWVRNLPTGEVEVRFEGPRAQVDAALRWCAQGPPSARVTDVSVSWVAPEGFATFDVRR